MISPTSHRYVRILCMVLNMQRGRIDPRSDSKFSAVQSWTYLSVKVVLKPVPKRQILDSSALKEYADDNFKFDENGRKFWWGENTVGKGEIAR